MAIIYHLASKAGWEEARFEEEYRAESLAREGCIHCAKDRNQALANRLFTGRTDVVVLEVDTSRLSSPLKHEPSRSGEVYPHIYGPLNTGAVVGVLSLSTGDGGVFRLGGPI
jgi:uncharacterized protein (DUF952 family)